MTLSQVPSAVGGCVVFFLIESITFPGTLLCPFLFLWFFPFYQSTFNFYYDDFYRDYFIFHSIPEVSIVFEKYWILWCWCVSQLYNKVNVILVINWIILFWCLPKYLHLQPHSCYHMWRPYFPFSKLTSSSVVSPKIRLVWQCKSI